MSVLNGKNFDENIFFTMQNLKINRKFNFPEKRGKIPQLQLNYIRNSATSEGQKIQKANNLIDGQKQKQKRMSFCLKHQDRAETKCIPIKFKTNKFEKKFSIPILHTDIFRKKSKIGKREDLCQNETYKLCKGISFKKFKKFNLLNFQGKIYNSNNVNPNDSLLFENFFIQKQKQKQNLNFNLNLNLNYPNKKIKIKYIKSQRHSQEPFIHNSDNQNIEKIKDRTIKKQLNSKPKLGFKPRFGEKILFRSISIKNPKDNNLNNNNYSYIFGEKNPKPILKALRNKKSLENPIKFMTVVTRVSTEQRRKSNLFYHIDRKPSLNKLYKNEEKQKIQNENKSRNLFLIIDQRRDKSKQCNLFNHISYSRIVKGKNCSIKNELDNKIVSPRKSENLELLFHKKNKEYYNKLQKSNIKWTINDSTCRSNIDNELSPWNYNHRKPSIGELSINS